MNLFQKSHTVVEHEGITTMEFKVEAGFGPIFSIYKYVSSFNDQIYLPVDVKHRGKLANPMQQKYYGPDAYKTPSQRHLSTDVTKETISGPCAVK